MPPKEHKSQRTEKPTGKRIKKAREKGNVPRSTEVSATMVLVGFLVYAYLGGGRWLDRLQSLMASSLAHLDRPDLTPSGLPELLAATTSSTATLLLPPLGLLAAAAVAGNLLQGPPPLTLYPLKPKFEKLNPINGLKKIVSLKQWVEMLKSLLKVVLYATVAFTTARDVILEGSARTPGAEGTLHMLLSLAGTVIVRVAMFAAGLAVLDYMFRRYEHTRGLKMSKREIKDEHKESEGDPLVRGRIRQRQMALSRSRMMADVPKASVVVTNPTHIAVALRYEAGETAAPQLLAKGRALLAERIREIAREHRVPIVSDPPLARALYRSVPVGAQIPPALFRAVAEVLALVFSRKRRRSPSPPGREVRP